MDGPTPYTYLDYRGFLKDWFAEKKRANPRFSHRAFVRLTGQRSPSLLVDVIEGRRNLTPTTTAAFCRAMRLSDEASEFFGLLVELDQARRPEDRNRAWERIAATRRFREAHRVEGEGFRYLSHWYYPAIRELAARPDFTADPDWIARTLRPTITPAQARRALEALLELGMLAPDKAGVPRPAEGSVVTPHQVRGLAVHNYHQGMLGLAQDAISAFRSDERYFSGLTVAVPRAALPILRRELEAVQERLLDLCDSDPTPAEQIIQVNVHFFPLSAPLQEDP